MTNSSSFFLLQRLSISVFISGMLLVFCAITAHAGSNQYGIKLYDQQKYEEARDAFEQNTTELWKDPSAAYYYALSLSALGNSSKALDVWQRIKLRFPHSKAAKQSTIAIEKWTRKMPHKASVRAKKPIGNGIVGFKFLSVKGREPQVENVFLDTPAEKANIEKGDAIVTIDGKPTIGLSKNGVFSLLVGEPGTNVSITLRRDGKIYKRTLKRMSLEELSKTQPDTANQYDESGSFKN